MRRPPARPCGGRSRNYAPPIITTIRKFCSDGWSNKTPEIFKTWIKSDNSLLVAVEDNDILAVGNITNTGEITLNYVSPDARFRGVSSALLTALEHRARERGNATCELESTDTARRFYLARGYSDNGTASAKFGTAGGYPMTKRLEIT